MVITRKTTIPMPPASRTSSTTATPKLNKGKSPQGTNIGEDQDTPRVNGFNSLETKYVGPQFSDDALFSGGSPPRKSAKDKLKGKSRKKAYAKRQKPPSSWLDLFSRIFILGFLTYSLMVCPQDKEQSLVCRGLSEYRRLVLEPYIITPVQNALHHPSVSPYTTPVINIATPVLVRTQKEWNARVVPQWNHRAVPFWRRMIVPRWNAYVAPQIEKVTEFTFPYQQAFSKYTAPYVAYAQQAALRARPVLIKTAAKAYDGYEVSRPYVGQVYLQLQRIPPFAMEYAIRPLASARRQFVDPHVALLVDKVKELSSGSRTVQDSMDTDDTTFTPLTVKEAEGSHESVTVELAPVPEAIEEPSLSSAASIISASAYLKEPAAESVPGATYSPAPEDEESAASLSSILASSSIVSEVLVTETAVEVETVVVEEVVTQVVQVIETAEVPFTPGQGEVVEVHTVVVQEVVTVTEVTGAPENPLTVEEHDIADAPLTDADILTGIATKEPAAVATELPKNLASEEAAPILVPKPHSHSSMPEAAINLKDNLVTDDDIEDFVAQLGLEDEESEASIEEPDPTPEVILETPEEKAAREAAQRAKVADKRRNIEARHKKWEDKLASTIESQSVVLRRAIIAHRKSAVADLKKNSAVREVIGTFDSEAQKALRGTHAYIAKLKGSEKSRDEQTRLWERVIERVQAKIEGRMKEVEEVVNKWYQDEVLAKENGEVEEASETVRNTAETGQADIGLDYAWLEDVTYNDWRRYHAMLDKHKDFLETSLALVNGSHPQAFANPVLDALQQLQEEVEEITTGFETRLRQIREEGSRSIASDKKPADAEDPAPEASILPIVGDGTKQGKSEEKVLQEVSDAILGRSEGEVAEALGRAEEQSGGFVAHEEL